MEDLKTYGVVIKEVKQNEADKLLTILTPDRGKLIVYGKGVISMRSPHLTSAQLFSYSYLVLRKSKKFFYIKDSDSLEVFFNIRYDIETLALAGYFCDVINDLSLEEEPDLELFRLIMNTLQALCYKKLPHEQIKAAFEFKAAVLAGYLPMLDFCGFCGNPTLQEPVLLDVMNGRLKCGSCISALQKEELDPDRTSEIYCKITPTVLSALRFIASADSAKFLSFRIPDDELFLLSHLAETYLISHLEHSFNTLKYYKEIKNKRYK